MKAVVQRVIDASVTVGGEARGSIGFGLLAYLGVASGDGESDADYLAEKIANLRIFDDSEGKMNLSLLDIVNHKNQNINNDDGSAGANGSAVNPTPEDINQFYVNHCFPSVNNAEKRSSDSTFLGEAPAKIGVLAVSQFTLLGDARKGRRPSWARAAPPEAAKQLYDYFMAKIREQGIICESGEFQAHMQVAYTNDGPVTILLDSRE